MAYERVNWENLPSTKTPVNADNLNKMDEGIANAEVYVGAEEPTTGGKVWFRKGKNLFDKSKALLGYWIGNEQGDIVKAANDVFVTDFIPVFKNVPVYIPATGSARRQFYNKNKVGITYLNNSKAQVFTPTEDGFIRVTCGISTVTMDSLMIYYGTTETEYEAYIEPQIFVKNSNGVYEEFIKKSEEVYSTNEQKIGKWIDGKPLYRKVYQSSEFSNKYNIPINNMNKLVDINGMIKRSDYNIYCKIPYRTGEASWNTSFGNINISNTIIETNIIYGSGFSTSNFSNIVIIVEYTKTTD